MGPSLKIKLVIIIVILALDLVYFSIGINHYVRREAKSQGVLTKYNADLSCNDSIRKLSNVRLYQLIKSNNINVRHLDELLGSSVDNGLTEIRSQIRVFLGQIECAKNELKKRGV